MITIEQLKEDLSVLHNLDKLPGDWPKCLDPDNLARLTLVISRYKGVIDPRYDDLQAAIATLELLLYDRNGNEEH